MTSGTQEAGFAVFSGVSRFPKPTGICIAQYLIRHQVAAQAENNGFIRVGFAPKLRRLAQKRFFRAIVFGFPMWKSVILVTEIENVAGAKTLRIFFKRRQWPFPGFPFENSNEVE